MVSKMVGASKQPVFLQKVKRGLIPILPSMEKKSNIRRVNATGLLCWI